MRIGIIVSIDRPKHIKQPIPTVPRIIETGVKRLRGHRLLRPHRARVVKNNQHLGPPLTCGQAISNVEFGVIGVQQGRIRREHSDYPEYPRPLIGPSLV